MRRGWVLLGSLLLAACSGARPPGAPEFVAAAPLVSPEAVEAARPPNPRELVAARGGSIMIYPADEATTMKRQRDTLTREFADQPKLDRSLPR